MTINALLEAAGGRGVDADEDADHVVRHGDPAAERVCVGRLCERRAKVLCWRDERVEGEEDTHAEQAECDVDQGALPMRHLVPGRRTLDARLDRGLRGSILVCRSQGWRGEAIVRPGEEALLFSSERSHGKRGYRFGSVGGALRGLGARPGGIRWRESL